MLEMKSECSITDALEAETDDAGLNSWMSFVTAISDMREPDYGLQSGPQNAYKMTLSR